MDVSGAATVARGAAAKARAASPHPAACPGDRVRMAASGGDAGQGAAIGTVRIEGRCRLVEVVTIVIFGLIGPLGIAA